MGEETGAQIGNVTRSGSHSKADQGLLTKQTLG